MLLPMRDFGPFYDRLWVISGHVWLHDKASALPLKADIRYRVWFRPDGANVQIKLKPCSLVVSAGLGELIVADAVFWVAPTVQV